MIGDNKNISVTFVRDILCDIFLSTDAICLLIKMKNIFYTYYMDLRTASYRHISERTIDYVLNFSSIIMVLWKFAINNK